MGPTRRLITHQATSWTQQLYKDTDTRWDAQRLHHPHPTTPMKTTAVTDTMKIYPFCSTSDDNTLQYLHGNSIHLHVHYSNTDLQQTRDASNVDIASALQHLGSLIQHSPYTRSNECVTFQAFLSTLLHQYDNNTTHHITIIDPDGDHPCRHTTIAPRDHRSITSLLTAWTRIRPNLTHDSADILTYTHGLVSSLPPANYSRATMNVIDHIYIGILPRSMHTTIRQFFSTFAAQQQRAHDTRFPSSRTQPQILTVWWDHAKAQSPTHTDLLDALNYLRPSNDMKLYQLVAKAWNKVTIALLQRARNVQTITEALVFNHTRSSKRHSKVTRATYPIPEPCGLTLVQTILPAHLRPQSAAPPTTTPQFTTRQTKVP